MHVQPVRWKHVGIATILLIALCSVLLFFTNQYLDDLARIEKFKGVQEEWHRLHPRSTEVNWPLPGGSIEQGKTNASNRPDVVDRRSEPPPISYMPVNIEKQSNGEQLYEKKIVSDHHAGSDNHRAGIRKYIIDSNIFHLREKATMSEVKSNLAAIRSTQVAFYAEWKSYYVGNVPLTPLRDRRGHPEKVAWNPNTHFSILGFAPEGGVYCSYTLEGLSSSKEGFAARIECDMDGDGQLEIYTDP